MSNRDYMTEKMIPVFAKYLRVYRAEAGMSQKECAKKLLISVRQLRNLESAISMPNALTLAFFLLLLEKEKAKAFLAEVKSAIES